GKKRVLEGPTTLYKKSLQARISNIDHSKKVPKEIPKKGKMKKTVEEKRRTSKEIFQLKNNSSSSGRSRILRKLFRK
ncbi:hypothetical protein KI387_044297, partial [Taxus chinensis]